MKINVEGTELSAYVASNSPGEPVCLNGKDMDDRGFQVQVYIVDDAIIGVTVSDPGAGIVAGAGLVPFDQDA